MIPGIRIDINDVNDLIMFLQTPEKVFFYF